MQMPQLYVHSVAPDSQNPFVHDRLERKALAEQLNSLIERLPNGAVFAIDAPWGNGKSWFGRNWHADLIANGYKSAYIDTFSADYMEDPFFLLTGEISIAFNLGKKSDFKDRSTKVAKALLPATTKVLINGIGKWVLGTSDASELLKEMAEKAIEDTADSIESYVAEKITDYEEEKKSVTQFREQLEILANQNFSKTGKPFVIFIDELDRCKPDFAVKTIERIKHFFEVKHLLFILLLNTKQIHESIRGVYGSNIEAEKYLSKFIQFSISLPLKKEKDDKGSYKRFTKQKLQDYGFPDPMYIERLASAFEDCGSAFNLTLRDIERCIILISLNPRNNKYQPILLAFGTCLKIGDSSAYEEITDEFNFSTEKINAATSRIHESNPDFYKILNTLHSAIKSKSEIQGEHYETIRNRLGITSVNSPKELLLFYKSMSLHIE